MAGIKVIFTRKRLVESVPEEEIKNGHHEDHHHP